MSSVFDILMNYSLFIFWMLVVLSVTLILVSVVFHRTFYIYAHACVFIVVVFSFLMLMFDYPYTSQKIKANIGILAASIAMAIIIKGNKSVLAKSSFFRIDKPAMSQKELDDHEEKLWKLLASIFSLAVLLLAKAILNIQ